MEGVMRYALDMTALLLCPVVPHIAEEIWAATGNKPGTLCDQPWPGYREDSLASATRLLVVQVNGKLRGRFEIDADADEETIKSRALEDPNAVRFIRGKTIRKVIVVRDKLVNIVV